MSAEKTIAICITGWHFPQDFYRKISQLSQADIFVIAHKPQEEAPAYLFHYLDQNNLYFEPNLGYDWGCYQQFLDKNFWRTYEYLFFIHDDVLIKNLGFIEQAITLLNSGASVVGNGRPGPKQPWPRLSAESYAYASWKPAGNFQHDVVRGSFFATTRKALEQLGHFEVFWDRFHLSSGFGNLSLKASCGKWEHYCGATCFQFLSEEYCTSEFLDEHVRGSAHEPAVSLTTWHKRIMIKGIVHLLRFYMAAVWRAPTAAMWAILKHFLQPVVAFIAAPAKR